MPEKLEFRILGPLEAYANGRPLRLGSPRQRAMLALLLVRRNEVVATDGLIDELWGEQPPGTAPKMVHNHVSRLRKEFAEAGVGEILTTRGRGYLLTVAPEQLDAARFEQLIEQARSQSDRAATATGLREALALWRGKPLSEFAYEPFAQAEIARLEELYLSALEDRIEADLALGRHGDLVGELEALVRSHPLRERLRGQQMVALYRSGRQAEALEAYREASSLLRDELGIEPGRALQELERAILLQDPALDAAVGPPPAPAVEPAAPAREVRKLVTALVAAVDTGVRPDPERLRRPLAEALETVSDVVGRHGGHVERRGGRTVTAVFGVPVVHEDDALRAVRAAVEVRDAFAAQLAESPLSVRVGIETGEVLAEGVEILAGDVVDRAAQLESAAASGEILIGPSAEEFVRDTAQVEPVDGTQMWRVEEASVGLPTLPRRRGAALVGRQRELVQLGDAFERAEGDESSYLFTLLGPPGIGKSRLAEEFTSSLGDRAVVLSGRCLSYGEGITFWPLAEILRQAAGAETYSAIADLLAGVPDAELIAQRLAEAVGLAEGAGPREELFWAARKLFEALARERPLVVVLDDLQWAEPTLLELLEHSADWIRAAPVFVLCLARPELLENRPAWSGGQLNATTLLLEPLSRVESESLIDELAGAQIEADARSKIAETAEGNPLFLEQLLLIFLRDGPPSNGDLAVPTTIQALLAARLERLPPEPRVALEHASVIGKDFGRDALEALSPQDVREELGRHLDVLVRHDLVRPVRSAGVEESYRFRHELIRDVAYDSLPKEARARLHEDVAGWIEGTSARREREYEELVGYHLERSYLYLVELGAVDDDARLLAERAAERLATAGRRAYTRGDVHAAAALLGRAADLVAAEAPERTELLADLGEALRDAGELARAAGVLREAAAGAARHGQPHLEAQARVALVRVRSQTDPSVTTDEMLAEAQGALEVLEPLGHEGLLAKAWELRAWALWVRCHAAAAEEALQEAITHARHAEDERTEAQSLNLLLGAAFFGPLPVPEAVGLCHEILEHTSERGRVAASALRAVAGLRAMLGAFDDAREALDASHAILTDLGLKVTAATAAETAGLVELLAGDPAAAERKLRLGHDVLEAMGETSSLSGVAAMLARALAAQGRYDEAARHAEASRRMAAADDLFAQVQWRGALAHLRVATGALGEAELLARGAVELAAETDFLVLRGDTLLDVAEVLHAAGRRDDAAAACDEAGRLYRLKGSVVSLQRAKRLRTPQKAS